MRTILSFEREKRRLNAAVAAPAISVRVRQARPVPEEPPAAGPAVGMFRATPEGEFIEASPAIAAMFGYADEHEFLAAQASDLYLDLEERGRWLALLDTYAGPVVFETAYLRRDGSILWGHHTSHAVRDESGKAVWYEGIFEDVTERRRADDELRARNAILEQRLREANETARSATVEAEVNRRELARLSTEMEECVRLVSHDLQEPLRMVSSFLQLIAQRYRGKLDSEAGKFIGYAVGGAARMKALITDLQGYLRIAFRPEAVQPADCRQIVEDVLQNLKPQLEDSNAAVSLGELPVIAADPRQLGIVFQHLIENAVKFRGGKPAEIHISAQRRGREWQFSVRDEGIGIASEHSTRIFGIFTRLHLEAEYPGTGIGLAVCRKIVELHGGRIWVESRPGAGATFHFALPDGDAAEAAAAPPASLAPARARAAR